MVEGLCSSDSGGVRVGRRRVGIERELGLLLGAGAGALRQPAAAAAAAPAAPGRGRQAGVALEHGEVAVAGG